jgi:hypothetical protein
MQGMMAGRVASLPPHQSGRVASAGICADLNRGQPFLGEADTAKQDPPWVPNVRKGDPMVCRRMPRWSSREQDGVRIREQ